TALPKEFWRPLASLCGREIAPGVSIRKSLQNFPSTTGASFWNSASIVSTLLGLVTSSIGASPDTVIDSSSAPSSIVISTWKLLPARSRMPSRRETENPASCAVTVKVPGGRLTTRYSPAVSVTVTRGPRSTSLVAVMVTPGSAPPWLSRTVPRRLPSPPWAHTWPAIRRLVTTVRVAIIVFMGAEYTPQRPPGFSMVVKKEAFVKRLTIAFVALLLVVVAVQAPQGQGGPPSPEQQAALARQDALEKATPQLQITDEVARLTIPGHTIGEAVGVAKNSKG